jgi:hypothetical protein
VDALEISRGTLPLLVIVVVLVVLWAVAVGRRR